MYTAARNPVRIKCCKRVRIVPSGQLALLIASYGSRRRLIAQIEAFVITYNRTEGPEKGTVVFVPPRRLDF